MRQNVFLFIIYKQNNNDKNDKIVENKLLLPLLTFSKSSGFLCGLKANRCIKRSLQKDKN